MDERWVRMYVFTSRNLVTREWIYLQTEDFVGDWVCVCNGFSCMCVCMYVFPTTHTRSQTHTHTLSILSFCIKHRSFTTLDEENRQTGNSVPIMAQSEKTAEKGIDWGSGVAASRVRVECITFLNCYEWVREGLSTPPSYNAGVISFQALVYRHGSRISDIYNLEGRWFLQDIY